jgi:NACalpha-BTF3-like transcription factor
MSVVDTSVVREESKALDSVTDYVEDKQLDASRAQSALSSLAGQQAVLLARQRREAELAAVKVNKEDIDAVIRELDVDKFKAERMLRESGGDLYKTLVQFVLQ